MESPASRRSQLCLFTVLACLSPRKTVDVTPPHLIQFGRYVENIQWRKMIASRKHTYYDLNGTAALHSQTGHEIRASPIDHSSDRATNPAHMYY
jgi:hypothetical protein